MPSLISTLIHKLMQTGDVQRQSFLHFGTSITITVLGFLVTMAVTHLAGSPDVPGGYFLFLSYLGIFSLISSGGLGGAAVNLMSREGRKDEYFTAYLTLRTFLLFVSLGFLILISPFLIDLTATGLLPWLISAVAITSLSDIVGTWLYGSGKVGYLQISTLINNIIRIFIQFFAILAGYGIAGLAGSVVAGLIAGTFYLIPLCRFKPTRFTCDTAKDLLRFSFWSLLATGGMVMYGNIDAILLGYFSTTSEVGLYRIALQLASFSLFAALALNTILYPKFAAWKEDERKAWISSSLARAISYSLLLALPICLGGVILSDKLLYFLYGSPYESAGSVLVLLLFAQVAYIFVYLWSMTLGALGLFQKTAIAALIATSINLPLNWILIPIYGINGAAGAILLTVIIHAICIGVSLNRQISLSLDFRALRSIGIAAIAMGMGVSIFTYFIPPTQAFVVGIAIFLGAGIYILSLLHLERGIETALRKMIQEMGIVLSEWL